MSEEVRRAVEGLESTSKSLDETVGDDVQADEITQSASDQLGGRFALVDADIVLRWRVKPGALIDYLSF